MLSFLSNAARRSIRLPMHEAPITTGHTRDRDRSNTHQPCDHRVDEDDRHDGEESIDSYDGGNRHEEGGEDEEDEEDDEEEEHDEEGEDTPLLPIFESSHLDSLPIYIITHAIRLLVTARCETTLSWDQLRSPQVSQFMVKPVQKDIIESNFSKATIYALLANCLQFQKEAGSNPAIVGVSKTRAMVCELLAMRLLKEYSTRELIDVLSYDFFPLQGMAELAARGRPQSQQQLKRPNVARTSALEVAIRASAKRFLAHPLVVQQLEAIWAGTIVFHHAADSAHRPHPKLPRLQQYGTMRSSTTMGLLGDNRRPVEQIQSSRRSVTLYDPRHASLLKLSRLRVPRYRHFTQTCSLAVFLALFVAVLIEKCVNITTLEVVFWFWSAGFMLDEVVGFNEQGFSLYIMSIWNAFDFGILLLLVCFYVLRLYGILLLDTHKQHVANLAFDVLASNSILLFPRLFSILDHYRYFSQLLIAFRMMAQDLAAVFILIVISCSGFLVAFTLSFGNDTLNPGKVAYQLFQLLMGFTPIAWGLWDEYNALGKALLSLFLIITHFLVVTILITVLTNSFMAIVQNANDEHQFVFAVNTISMVKSDALFTYIAPSNILGWLLAPLRYVLPFRRFIWVNRTIIKFTHFPILFAIFLYERLILRHSGYGPVEQVERGRSTTRFKSFDPADSGITIFPPRKPRLREPSAATFHKDRALAEVFRQPFNDETLRKSEKTRKKQKATAVSDWMKAMGPDGRASPPDEQDHAIVDRLERPRYGFRWPISRRLVSGMSMGTRSLAASDPEDFIGRDFPFSQPNKRVRKAISVGEDDEEPHDGDDELITNDDATEQITIDENETGSDKENQVTNPRRSLESAVLQDEFPRRPPMVERQSSISFADSGPKRHTPPVRRPPMGRAPTSRRVPRHQRDISIQTVLFNPDAVLPDRSSENPVSKQQAIRHTSMSNATISETQAASSPSTKKAGKSRHQRLKGTKTPAIATAPRPILPARDAAQSTPNIHNLLPRQPNGHDSTFSPSPPASFAAGPRFHGTLHASYPRGDSFDLASDLGDNKAVGAHVVSAGAMPASFATQMAFADRLRRMRSTERKDDDARMSRLMLVRMGVLEEGFREMLKEVKGIKGGEKEKGKRKMGTRHMRSGLTTPRLGLRVSTSNSATASEAGEKTPKRQSWYAETKEDGLWVDDGTLPEGERGSSI